MLHVRWHFAGKNVLEFCQRGVDLESFADRLAADRAEVVFAQVELYDVERV